MGEAPSDQIVDFWILLPLAVILSIVHIYSPVIGRYISARASTVGALGSGLAIAYVFVKLLPELDRTHETIGDSIYSITLVGFLAFYILERWAYHREVRKSNAGLFTFNVRIVIYWIYNWLLIYTLLEYIHTKTLPAMLNFLLLSVHLATNDQGLLERHRKSFLEWGRYFLATAPIVGWSTSLIFDSSDLIADLLIGVLAGFILFRVFNEELPKHSQPGVVWFTVGVAFSAISLTLLQVHSKT